VHRSGLGDYLQDIGVLLVSNVRNPIEDEHVVADLAQLNELIREFALEFARSIFLQGVRLLERATALAA
jgi:hypothetical protein